ncbi:MAG: glycoside hydrolase 43 family protein [Clostridia bacterium]|nr:glycoside hydrolase 43 family protein [Clostridia bacterium]
MMTYKNPIIEADFPDPDVIRVGDAFYMVSSSFNFSPAIPLMESVNLVEWKLIGHVMEKLPRGFESVRPGEGVWAPSLRYRAGKFYCVFPLYGEGIYMCETSDIHGEWSRPVKILDGEGLEDPCPIWTDDGRAYMAVAYAKSKAGFNSRIDVCEMSRDLKERFSPFRTVYEDPVRNPTIEGPKFHKIGDWFYLSCPAGGVETGWQVMLRSKDVYGPYEAKTVLMKGDTKVKGPHQGALVDLPDGGWAFLHYASAGPYGRVIYLEPVKWADGWPTVGLKKDKYGFGTPVEGGEFPVEVTHGDGISFDDDFKNGLSRVWQTPAVCEDGWFDARRGLTLHARPGDEIEAFPYVLSVRFPCFDFTAETDIDLSGFDLGSAGVCVLGRVNFFLEFPGRDDDHRFVTLTREEGDAWKEIFHMREKGDTHKITLVCRSFRKDSYVGAECRFHVDGYDVGTRFFPSPGVWTGARVGLFAMGRGDVKFSYFRVAKLCEG